MAFLSRMRFSVKLGLMSGAAVVGLALFALLFSLTLRDVRINSPMYQDIALGYQLAGDCYDPPASLVAALPAAIAAEDASTPEETAIAIDLLRQAHKEFTDSQKHYSDVLPTGSIRDLMSTTTSPTGEEWFSIAEKEYIPALLAGDHEAARKIRIAKMNPLFVQHKAGNDKLSDLTGSWIPTQEKNAASIIQRRSIQLSVLCVCLVLALGLLGVAITRSIVRPVRRVVGVLEAMAGGDLTQTFEVDSADEMREVADALNRTIASFREVLSTISLAANSAAAASAELTATVEESSMHSREHAGAVQQVAAAMEEMSAAIGEVTNASQAAANSGSATAKAADRGSHVVEETMGVIRRAAQVTSEATGQIESLGKSSEQIGRIVGVIEEIASQTNLLALNAAIEAARAGEQGRGFAVVAGEVRRLAERTTTATREIGAMISSIQSETGNAVQSIENGHREVDASLRKVEECSSALEEIVRLVREEGGMMQRIASSSRQQTAAAGQVSESMNEITRFTENATTSGEQTVVACADLARLASDLERQVQGFNISQRNAGNRN